MIIIDKKKSCICTCEDGTSYFIRKCPVRTAVHKTETNKKTANKRTVYSIYHIEQKGTKEVIAHYRRYNRLVLPNSTQKQLCTFNARNYLSITDKYNLHTLREYISKNPIMQR